MQCIVSLPVQSSPLEMSTKYPANATIFHSSLGGALNFNKSIESSVVIYFFFFFPQLRFRSGAFLRESRAEQTRLSPSCAIAFDYL